MTAAAALAVAASPARASTTFGSDLAEPISGSLQNGCISAGPCTTLNDAVRPGNAFPAASPIAGVVVSFGIKTSGPETVTFRLGHLVTSVNGTGTGTGPTANLAAAGTFSVPARLPVQSGDLVGFDYVTNYSAGSTSGDGHALYWAPPLVDGAAPRAPTASGGIDHLVNAVVEQDADHDIFGDETQDKCVGTAGTFNGCPNSVTLGKVTPKGAKVKVSAVVPGAGTLTVGSASDPALAAQAAKSKALLKSVAVVLTSTSPQQVVLTVKLTKAAKQRLAENGKLTLKVKAVYTPAGGPPGSQTKKVKLRS